MIKYQARISCRRRRRHLCSFTSVTMYVNGEGTNICWHHKRKKAAGGGGERKIQINLGVESVRGLQWSGHGTHIHWSHEMMCLGFDEREDATRNQCGADAE